MKLSEVVLDNIDIFAGHVSEDKSDLSKELFVLDQVFFIVSFSVDLGESHWLLLHHGHLLLHRLHSHLSHVHAHAHSSHSTHLLHGADLRHLCGLHLVDSVHIVLILHLLSELHQAKISVVTVGVREAFGI